jgi:hypothetical protein
MATVNLAPSYARFLDRVVESLTPEEILAFHVSEEEQCRADELLDKNNENELTAEEKVELEQMVQFDEMMTLLKVRAAYKLRQS